MWGKSFWSNSFWSGEFWGPLSGTPPPPSTGGIDINYNMKRYLPGRANYSVI